MQEQNAVLVKHKNKWVLFTDNDERVWFDINAAKLQLEQEGWEVVRNTATIMLSSIGIDNSHAWGYILRRNT
jgi:hypothetical protein